MFRVADDAAADEEVAEVEMADVTAEEAAAEDSANMADVRTEDDEEKDIIPTGIRLRATSQHSWVAGSSTTAHNK